MWAAWQLSVLAIGFTCFDHCQPGSNVARPTDPPSRLTSSRRPLPSSNCRVSSGLSRLLRKRAAMTPPVLDFHVAWLQRTKSQVAVVLLGPERLPQVAR